MLGILCWLIYSASLGSVLALAVNTVIYGRIPLSTVISQWPGGLTGVAAWSLGFAWWLFYGLAFRQAGGRFRYRLLVIPSIPLLVVIVPLLVSIYISDEVNHYFYYSMVHLNQPKSLALLSILGMATVVLQAACLEIRSGHPPALALRLASVRCSEPLILSCLVLIGVLQASSYWVLPGQDFLRYWSIADAFSQGAPYPAIESTSDYLAAGRAPYLVDLPMFPAMLVISFAVLGHTVPAAYAPIVVANVAIPPLMYLLARQLLTSRVLAVSLTSLLVLFPPFRFYTLNWVVPDAGFVMAVSGCALLAIRLTGGENRKPIWILFALSCAVVALTRPEGIAYSSCFAAMVLFSPSSRLLRALFVTLFAIPVCTFSIIMAKTFGSPWAEGYGGTIRIENLAVNLPVLVEDEFFQAAVRLTSLELGLRWGALLLLALVGSIPFLLQPRRLALLMAPAWINLLAILMADPRVSGARLWFDFFRHTSYPLPLLILAWGVGAEALCHLSKGRAKIQAARFLLSALIVAGVLWNLHFLSKPSWNFGPDSGNLLSQPRVNIVDLFQNPLPLPSIEFEPVAGHSQAKFPPDFINNYPEPISRYYDRFDAVKNGSGTAYQTGSLFAFLALLVLASWSELCVPSATIREKSPG